MMSRRVPENAYELRKSGLIAFDTNVRAAVITIVAEIAQSRFFVRPTLSPSPRGHIGRDQLSQRRHVSSNYPIADTGQSLGY